MNERRHLEDGSAPVHLGVVDHLGWAIIVTATASGTVLDRRRIEMIEPGLPQAPVHHLGGPHELHRTGEPLSDEELLAVIASVRASAARTIDESFEQLQADLRRPVATVSLRHWPEDFPTDLATQRRAPWEARADPVMYRTLLANAAVQRSWQIRTFEVKTIEGEALRTLGAEDDTPLRLPRTRLGPPWTKDHRAALAAAIAAASETSRG